MEGPDGAMDALVRRSWGLLLPPPRVGGTQRKHKAEQEFRIDLKLNTHSTDFPLRLHTYKRRAWSHAHARTHSSPCVAKPRQEAQGIGARPPQKAAGLLIVVRPPITRRDKTRHTHYCCGPCQCFTLRGLTFLHTLVHTHMKDTYTLRQGKTDI